MIQPLTEAELLAQPPSVDLATAGRAFRMGRTKAYELAREGRFPVEVLQCGPKFVVPKRAILEALGIDPDAVATRPPQPSRTRRSSAPRRSSLPDRIRAAADPDPQPAA